MLPYSPFTKPSLSEMQSQATFVILSSRTLVIFSNFFHQIHQKGRDAKLIRSGLMVAFLALTRGQCRDSAKVSR